MFTVVKPRGVQKLCHALEPALNARDSFVGLPVGREHVNRLTLSVGPEFWHPIRCFLVVSLLYLLFRRALAVAALRLRSPEFKELEIVVLRHELAVLRRQIPRPRLDESDRVFLAAASQLLGRASRSFFVRPDTLLGWHRHLVRRRWTSEAI